MRHALTVVTRDDKLDLLIVLTCLALLLVAFVVFLLCGVYLTR